MAMAKPSHSLSTATPSRLPSSLLAPRANKPRTRPSSFNLSPLRCSASSPRSFGEFRAAQSRRRSVSISTALLLALFPHRAIADGGILDKYVKKKKLDPLDAYVPAVILTQLQIEDLGKTLDGNDPEFAFCRSLLRSGPAASLRVNIRAVAQYASESGDGDTAFNDVDRCLRALEELDSLLRHALRKEPEASVSSMKAKIDVAVNALDSLLQTVPENILDKGKAIADAYRSPADEECVIGPRDQAIGINFMKTPIPGGISSHYERFDLGSSSSMVLGSARSLHCRKAEHW